MGKEKVVVGLSGGVDSSVAAALLKEQGYEVIGLFMRNWHETDPLGICTAEQDFADAKAVAASLDIPYYSIDFSKEFTERVFSHFVEEYLAGRTPNPDVLCNKEIKFDEFAKYAQKMGAKYIATGHYCNTEALDGHIWLTDAFDQNKDQTYFLSQVEESQLENALFPVGNLTKPTVRALAKKLNLRTAEKKDSTGVCFIGERNFREFLSAYIPIKEGDIVDESGTVIGRHCGVYYYTLGQRKGLGIGGGHSESGAPWVVLKKDLDANTLVVTQDEALLLSDTLTTSKFNFISGLPSTISGAATDSESRPKAGITFDCSVRIRHRQPKQKAAATLNDDGGITLRFQTPQRAIAAGQYAVVYSGNLCLGSGVIV